MPRVLLVVLTLTAGTAMLMWMGELITQRGIGNGMSLLIFASVVSGLPGQGAPIRAEGGNVSSPSSSPSRSCCWWPIVFIEQGQRRIPVQFAKRVVGRRMYGGQSTYIPLKVNQSGVIPIIFASSVLYLPCCSRNVLPARWDRRPRAGSTTTSCSPTRPRATSRIYGLLIVGFAYFYTAITFDPTKQADTIRKQGGFIPGIRPGPADRAPPGQDPQPHHAARRAVPRRSSPCCPSLVARRSANIDQLPVRRHRRCSSPSASPSRR